MKRLLSSLAFALALAGAAQAQTAQGLDGRWEGAIDRPNGSPLTGVFRIETKDGKTAGVFDSPDQGAKDIAATVERQGDDVTLGVPIAGMVYTAKISADGSTLTGAVAQGGGSVPLTMTKKAAASPPPSTPAVDGLDGEWAGTLTTPVGDMNVAMRLVTRNGRTTTVMDSLNENIMGIPALTSRNGQKVLIEAPGINGKFDAELSADGEKLAGMWDQVGQTFPLTLEKK